MPGKVDEVKWNRAKAIVRGQKGGVHNKYALVNHIYQNMGGTFHNTRKSLGENTMGSQYEKIMNDHKLTHQDLVKSMLAEVAGESALINDLRKDVNRVMHDVEKGGLKHKLFNIGRTLTGSRAHRIGEKVVRVRNVVNPLDPLPKRMGQEYMSARSWLDSMERRGPIHRKALRAAGKLQDRAALTGLGVAGGAGAYGLYRHYKNKTNKLDSINDINKNIREMKHMHDSTLARMGSSKKEIKQSWKLAVKLNAKKLGLSPKKYLLMGKLDAINDMCKGILGRGLMAATRGVRRVGSGVENLGGRMYNARTARSGVSGAKNFAERGMSRIGGAMRTATPRQVAVGAGVVGAGAAGGYMMHRRNQNRRQG